MTKAVLLMWALLCLQTSAFAQTVVFLDEGINLDHTWSAKSKTLQQRCNSIYTRVIPPAGNDPAKLVQGNLCKTQTTYGGQKETPDEYAEFRDEKVFKYRVTNPVIDLEFPVDLERTDPRTGDKLKLNHGNYVSNAAWNFDDTLFHTPFQVFGLFLDEVNQVKRFRTFGQIPGQPRVQRAGFNILEALDNLAYAELNDTPNGIDVGAVSISIVLQGGSGLDSADDMCLDGFAQGAVNRLRDRGIAVITGMRNEDIPVTELTWPQCLDHVINVGSAVAHQHANEPGHQIGIGANEIHFFAKDTTTGGSRGNSFAAPRIASAYARLHKEFPLSSVDQKTQALEAADDRMSFYNQKNSNGTLFKKHTLRYVQKGHMPKAIELLGLLTFPPDTTPEAIIAASHLDFVDPNQYGTYYETTSTESSYSFVVRLGFLRPILNKDTASQADTQIAATASSVLGNARDVVVRFTGGFGGGGYNGFKVMVGGTQVASSVGSVSGGSEKEYALVINRKYLDDADTTVQIAPLVSSSDWGIKGITAQFLPVVPLTIGETNTTQYGYEHDPTRYTGIRASFELPSVETDVVLSFTAWDIDVADETSIFVNGQFIEYANQSLGSSEYSAPDVHFLARSVLRQGLNYIELVQRSPGTGWLGLQDEKWAVKDLRVQAARPDLLVSSVDIIERQLKPNVPFSVSTIINNVGEGSSGEINVRFYLSTDALITPNDTELTVQSVMSISPGGLRETNVSLQSTLMNQAYFIGVCADVVLGELSTNNNCSDGVPFENQFSIVPILMQLLLFSDL